MNPGTHLNDEQIAASVIETDPGLAAHLRDCAECSAKAERLRASLTGFGEFVRQNADRANTFWWRQRAASPAPRVPLTRWALATAAAVVAIAASTSLMHKTEQKPVVLMPAVQQMSDEALLREVQNDSQREYPDAFAPVETNAESAVASQTVSSRKKETKKK